MSITPQSEYIPIFMIDKYHPTKKKMLLRKNPRSIS